MLQYNTERRCSKLMLINWHPVIKKFKKKIKKKNSKQKFKKKFTKKIYKKKIAFLHKVCVASHSSYHTHRITLVVSHSHATSGGI